MRMNRALAFAFLLAGCTTPQDVPAHPLVGTWQGSKTLMLTGTEYRLGSETGHWTAGRSDFRYRKAGGALERCNYSLTGRVLVLSDCRLAGQYTRTP